MKSLLLIFSLVLLYATSCKCKERRTFTDAVKELPPSDTTHPRSVITWDSFERKISHNVYFSEYGRIRRIAGDTLLLIYHCGTVNNEWDNIAIRKSLDNGKTWSSASIIVADNDPGYTGFSTPELLLLKNSWLLLAYSGRGIPDDTLHNNLQLCISKDNGETWGKPRIIAVGRNWEPGMIQLPDGEINLFFSNELFSKFSGGRPEQKILMISSGNNGMDWSVPKVVAYTPGCRDGMPVPVVLKDDKGIVFAIEVVGNEKSPEMLWSSVKTRWSYDTVGSVQNGRRWNGGIAPVWGGAPYLLQLPTGETVITMQTDEGRMMTGTDAWKKNTLVVFVGNSVANNFSNKSMPYPNLPVDQGAYFSSLFLKNDSTLVLLATRTFPDKGSGVYFKEGHILRTP